MPDNSALSTRMKENYENRSKQFLLRRTPTIIRLDGKTFSKYTENLQKPFDEGLIEDMQETTKFLCENIQGCKMGYTQSDEITLVLTDYDKLETSAWFDYNVQKMTSISASLATAKFNQLRLQRYFNTLNNLLDKNAKEFKTGRIGEIRTDNLENNQKLAFFDSRVFQIPEKEEVVNCLIWRQRDAEKNSIAMLAQSLYSHKELFKKNGSDMQEMCFQKGQNWNDLHFSKKRGSFIVKNTYVNDELSIVYPDLAFRDGDEGKLEFYPKNCREDIKEDRCRRYNPEYEEGSGYRDSWDVVAINKIRSKWEVVETPIFSKDRDSILKLI